MYVFATARKPTAAVWMGVSIHHRYLKNFPQTALMQLIPSSLHVFPLHEVQISCNIEKMQVEKKVIVLLYVQHINWHSRVSNQRWNQAADIAVPNIPKPFHRDWVCFLGCLYAKWEDSTHFNFMKRMSPKSAQTAVSLKVTFLSKKAITINELGYGVESVFDGPNFLIPSKFYNASNQIKTVLLSLWTLNIISIGFSFPYSSRSCHLCHKQ